MVKLGEVCTLNPRKDKAISSDTTISFIEMKSLLENGSVFPVLQPAEKYLKGYSPFQKQDVLVAKITPCFQNNKIGVASIETEFGFGTTEFHVLRVHEELLLSEYLVLFLRQQQVLVAGEAQMTGSGGQRRVPKSFFENLLIPLPPLNEQKRIAEILGWVTKAVYSLQEQLDWVERALKSNLQDGRGGGTQEVLLSDFVVRISTGKSMPDGDMKKPKYQVLKTSAITSGFFKEDEAKGLPEGYAPPLTHKVNVGDILVSRMNTTELVGASAIVESVGENIYLPDRLWKLHLVEGTDPFFLWQLLQTRLIRARISQVSSGSSGSMKNISQKTFLNIKVPFASSAEQSSIGEAVQSLLHLRQLLHQKLTLLQELQRSLSARAFAGQL